jgi:hypothetical protein
VHLLKAGASEVRCYAFDFFRSGHFQERDPGGYNDASPLAWTHNPDYERLAWKELLKKNRNVLIPDPVMHKALR